MGYKCVYKSWLPYAKMSDPRGFISQRFSNGGHTGVDSVGNLFANSVCAAMDGQVIAAGWDNAYGNIVKWRNGNLVMEYCHLASRNVQVGDQVVAGETIIGVEGATGYYARGKHLHVSLWIDDKLVDPEPYLAGKKQLPVVNHSNGDDIMIRKVVKPLNIRSGAGCQHSIVYNNLPVGTTFVASGATVNVLGYEWGRVYAVVNGQAYAGWANLDETWSVEV